MAATTELEPVTSTPRGEEPLYEVVRGRRVELPPMEAYPTHIASNLGQFLGSFVRSQRLGRVEVEMLFLIDAAEDHQRRPDVAFISYERWARNRPVPDDAAWEVVPDLAIEVVSPTDRAEDALEKVRDYFRAGVRAVWMIYPKLRVIHLFDAFTAIRVLTHADELDGGAVIPGFRLPLATLFEDEAEGQGP
jgi:Uma2 family endonuclease